ncbi:MAG: hypothetical protein ABH827_03210 [bacterium]
MEVKELRADINEALSNPDETTRVGEFWCIEDEYTDCFPLFKKIFLDKKMEELIDKECIIKRCPEGFLVKDAYGDQEVFTHDEIALFIDLWQKAQKCVPLHEQYKK